MGARLRRGRDGACHTGGAWRDPTGHIAITYSPGRIRISSAALTAEPDSETTRHTLATMFAAPKIGSVSISRLGTPCAELRSDPRRQDPGPLLARLAALLHGGARTPPLAFAPAFTARHHQGIVRRDRLGDRVTGCARYERTSVPCDGGPTPTEFSFRLTAGLRKTGGEWRIVHEHHSVRTEDGRHRAPTRSAN